MVMWINLPFSVDGISVDVDNSGCACARVRTVNGVIHNSYPHGVARYPRCPAGRFWLRWGVFRSTTVRINYHWAHDHRVYDHRAYYYLVHYNPVARLFHFSYFQDFFCRFPH